MGERTRRTAQRGVLAACAALLGAPAAAHAVAPGGAVDAAAPVLDRRGAAGPVPARVREARAALERRFGEQLVLDVDPATGGARVVTRLAGALSSPAAGDRAALARGWVRENRAVLGLDAAAVEALDVAERRTVGRSGLTQVRFAQAVRGVPVHDGGVTVTLDRGGRVLAATGRPVADLDVGSLEPRLDPAAARAALDAGVGPTRPLAPAALTLFPTARGTRLAWRLVQERSSAATYAAVVDARDGTVLLRQNLVKSEAPALVAPNFPGAGTDEASAAANAPQAVDLEAAGHLPPGATGLDGPFARAFSDLDDDDVQDPGEGVVRAESGFRFGFVPTMAACPPTALAATPACTFDPARQDWPTNRQQNAVQAFALVNRFRDHLERPQIAFGADGFAGADRVIVHARDGAALRDREHRNNANMRVLPDPLPPTMQMYLFEPTLRGANGALTTQPSGFRAIDGGDDAATVWHEYAHGLSGRLITHADGTSALASVHGGALGEAWSDFYALDLLHRQGLETDDAAPGDVDVGAYSDAVPHATRTQGADCRVGDPAPACPGGFATGGGGGYTLGDLGRVAAQVDERGARTPAPEVHADGEIWLELLWDLRRALVTKLGSETAGSDAVLQLVTDGMRLAPPEPSFLDARNAMLTADTAAGGAHHPELWAAFAARGLGYGASARDANDVAPLEDFTLPPTAATPRGELRGRVTDAGGRLPLAGVRIAQPVPSGEGAATTTAADGSWALTLPATGPTPARLRFTGPAGYDAATATAPVPAGGSGALDVALRRDWAASAGGARIVEGDAAEECGPRQALDEVEAAGWSAFRPARGSSRPSIVIELPTAVDVSAIAIDPAATCGDDGSAALRQFTVASVRDGTELPMGGGFFVASADGRVNLVAPSGNARAVTRLRLTLVAAASQDSPFVDLTSLAVYGTRADGAPRGELRATPAAVAPGAEVRLDASSFTDPDSLIEEYAWDFDGDGGIDRRTAEPTTTTAYAAPGAYTAQVRVRDVGGAEGRAAAALRVSDPTPPPPPPTAPPTTTTQPPAPPRVTPAPTVRLAATGRRAATVTVRCAGRCTARATGTVSAATARRLRLPRRTVLRATSSRSDAGALRLPLAPTALATARRRGVRSLLVAVSVRVSDPAGRSVSRRATVRVST